MTELSRAGFWKKLFARRQRADAPAMMAPPEPVAVLAPPEQVAVPAPPEQVAVLAPPEQVGVPAPREPVAVLAPPEQVGVPAPEEPVEPDPVKVLNEALDSLGRAHHRPFSRA